MIYHLTFLFRHPGDVSNWDEYGYHLPTQWCPMVTVIGFVGYRNDKPANESGLRHFELQTTVYDPDNDDPSNPKSTGFSIFCFFPHGNRWKNTAVPNAGSCVSITAKVMGRVTKKNCLAVRMLDLGYLSLPSTSSATLNQSTPTKRANHWSQRADSATPSKKIRNSVPEEDPITPSTSAPQALQPELKRHLSATISGDTSSNDQSLVERDESPVERDESPADSTTAQPLSSNGRPKRTTKPSSRLQNA